jgi:transcriptional regulator with XRE-family HTH domain
MALSQEPFYRELGERLRRARQSARLTQGKLADAVQLSRSSIANIERGRQPIYIHALVRIAKRLQIPISNLIPPTTKELDENETEAVMRLPDDQRRFLNLVFQKSAPRLKEKDASEIFLGKKTSGRTTQTSARQKGTGPH